MVGPGDLADRPARELDANGFELRDVFAGRVRDEAPSS